MIKIVYGTKMLSSFLNNRPACIINLIRSFVTTFRRQLLKKRLALNLHSKFQPTINLFLFITILNMFSFVKSNKQNVNDDYFPTYFLSNASFLKTFLSNVLLKMLLFIFVGFFHIPLVMYVHTPLTTMLAMNQSYPSTIYFITIPHIEGILSRVVT